MVNTLRQYALPLLLALLLHGLAAWSLYQGWHPEQDIAEFIRPEIVKTTLVVLEPKAKPKPVPTQVAKPAPPPVQKKPDPKPTPKPEVKPEPKPDPALEQQKLEAERRAQEAAEREERLAQLAEQSFEELLAEEASALEADEDAAVAMSFQRAIHERVKANWSRPPSARNGMKAKLVVDLIPTGDVVGVSLVESSGNTAFDRSAEQAVRKARKFEVPEDSALFEKRFRRFYLLFQPEDLLR